MKKLSLLSFFAVLLSLNSFSQTQPLQSEQFLNSYFNVKDALVAGNSALAASRAIEFQAILKTPDQQLLGDSEKASLEKDVSAIAGSKNIADQRAAFSKLSNSMISLAKSKKLSSQPLYQQYCPMKKSAWLSKEKVIRNPYYGASMLTCGQVQATL